MLLRPGLALLLAAAASGCGGSATPSTTGPLETPDGGGVAVPDGGVARGHGAGDDRRIRVPETDDTPPLAIIRLYPGADARVVEHRSPVRPAHAEAVRLARPFVRATALIRDTDGGTGRIRLTVTWEADCAEGQRIRVVHHPPSQIERIRLVPGVLAPVERRRSGVVRLPRDCRVTGKAFADATNASGLESFSDPVRFVYLGSRGERMR